MSILRALRAGVRVLVQRDVVDRELDDEMQHYLEESMRDKMRQGLSREDAQRAARLELGRTTVTREAVRSAGWESVVDSVIRDLTYAVRGIRRSPGFATIAVLTLSIGMAGTTSVLTAANTVLRERWAVPRADRIYSILSAHGGPAFSPAARRFVAERTGELGALVMMRCIHGLNADCVLDLNGTKATVDFVSGNYFAALAVPMQIGHAFGPDDDRILDPRAVVVISDAAWRARFGADPSIIGRRIRIDDVPMTVVGVTASGFVGTRTEAREAWLPMASMLTLRPNRADVRGQLTEPSPDVSDGSVAMRLAPGVSPGQAESRLSAVLRTYRQENGLSAGNGVRLVPATLFPNPGKIRIARTSFALMLSAASLLLFLACANVGNLLLARAATRGREIGVRLALGASRRRVIRQLLVESSMLATVSAAIGLAISYRLPSAIMANTMGEVTWHFRPDTLVLAAALGLTVLTCIGFGLAPAFHATRADVSTVIKAAGPVSGDTGRSTLRGGLLAMQIAISFVLLVSAGLLIRGVTAVRDRDLGFKPAGIDIVSFDLPASYDSTRIAAFTRQLMSQREAFGVSDIAFVESAPLDRGSQARVRLPGEPSSRVHLPWSVEMTPGTLGLLGTPIIAGRDLTSLDDDDAVLVNESLAHHLWPDEPALGRTVVDDRERRVVGIVKDAVVYRLDRVEDVLFRPLRFNATPVMLARGLTPAALQAITVIATRIDRQVHVRRDSVAANVDRQLGPSKVAAELASVLGLIALVLASVGVFGVFSFVVQQRTREIGIRAALGAPAARIVSVVVRDNLRSMTIGLATGFAAAVGVGRLIESQLYGARAFDSVAFAGAAALLLVAGVAATYLPARRAARIDPLIALREE